MSKLNADQISAAIDGDIDETVKNILDNDPVSRELLEDAREFENALHQKLYRWDCPNALDLGSYSHGLLNSSETEVFEQHLHNCIHCQEELEELKEFLTLDDGDDSLSEGWKPVYVNTHRSKELLLSASSAADLATNETFALRGEENNMRSFEFYADGMLVFLEAKLQGSEWEITGSIVASDIELQKEMSQIIIEFWQNDDLQKAIFTDEDGKFETMITLNAKQPIVLRATIRPSYVIKINDIILWEAKS